MSFAQIIIYSFILLIIFLYIRKALLARSVKQYSPDEAKARVNERQAVLLDVRTDAERKSHSIKGSLHIPLSILSGRTDELKKYKDKEFICYCRSGNRSLSAAVILNKKGFNASNLKGGITRWNF